jgi:hypothetical protein
MNTLFQGMSIKNVLVQSQLSQQVSSTLLDRAPRPEPQDLNHIFPLPLPEAEHCKQL